MGRGGEKGWFYKALAAGWWWLGHLTPFDSIGRARYGNEWGGGEGRWAAAGGAGGGDG